MPKCVCGADRVFEFQFVPSLLHALDVDSHATTSSDSLTGDTDSMMDLMSAGGMNRGQAEMSLLLCKMLLALPRYNRKLKAVPMTVMMTWMAVEIQSF